MRHKLSRRALRGDVGIVARKHIALLTDCTSPEGSFFLIGDVTVGVEDGTALCAAQRVVLDGRQVRALLQRREQARHWHNLQPMILCKQIGGSHHAGGLDTCCRQHVPRETHAVRVFTRCYPLLVCCHRLLRGENKNNKPRMPKVIEMYVFYCRLKGKRGQSTWQSAMQFETVLRRNRA